MGLWKGAWCLAKHELVKDRWGSIFSLVLVGYLLLFSLPALNELFDEDESSWMWTIDLIYLTLLPCLGFILNKTMINYLRENTYTKKLAQWRTLPISSKQIAFGRMIQLTIVLFLTELIFFVFQFVVLRSMGAELPVGTFVLYGLFWFGYSLTIATTYVYWEVGHNSKVYFIFNLCYMVSLIGVTLSLTYFGIGNVMVTSLKSIQEGNWWMVIIAIAVSACAVVIVVKRTENRLENRAYRA